MLERRKIIGISRSTFGTQHLDVDFRNIQYTSLYTLTIVCDYETKNQILAAPITGVVILTLTEALFFWTYTDFILFF
jgi:hypothetical protein